MFDYQRVGQSRCANIEEVPVTVSNEAVEVAGAEMCRVRVALCYSIDANDSTSGVRPNRAS